MYLVLYCTWFAASTCSCTALSIEPSAEVFSMLDERLISAYRTSALLSRRMPPCAPRIAVALWYTSRYAHTEAT
jgi:hypothetical protein